MDALSDFADLMAGSGTVSADTAADRGRTRRVLGRILLAMVLVIALGALSAGGYAAWALSAPLPAPTAQLQDRAVAASEPVAVAEPSQGASAVTVSGAPEYLGADGLHAASGTTDAVPIASITKPIPWARGMPAPRSPSAPPTTLSTTPTTCGVRRSRPCPRAAP